MARRVLFANRFFGGERKLNRAAFCGSGQQLRTHGRAIPFDARPVLFFCATSLCHHCSAIAVLQTCSESARCPRVDPAQSSAVVFAADDHDHAISDVSPIGDNLRGREGEASRDPLWKSNADDFHRLTHSRGVELLTTEVLGSDFALTVLMFKSHYHTSTTQHVCEWKSPEKVSGIEQLAILDKLRFCRGFHAICEVAKVVDIVEVTSSSLVSSNSQRTIWQLDDE